MVYADQPILPTARAYPDRVPLLVDHAAGILLRPTKPSDLPALVELARDPETIRWTAVPIPNGGYHLSDAAAFIAVESEGWQTGRGLGWAIEAERDGTREFCGHVNLHLEDPGLAEIGFALHPAARGRSIMSTAVRLVRDYGFDVAGLETIRWRSVVGNWGARRIASAAGFVFDGTVRQMLVQRGERRDAWVATITRDDPRRPHEWSAPVDLRGERVILRAFRVDDVPRIVEGCSDERTRLLADLVAAAVRDLGCSRVPRGRPGDRGDRRRRGVVRGRSRRRPLPGFDQPGRDSADTPSGPRSATGPTRRPAAAG